MPSYTNTLESRISYATAWNSFFEKKKKNKLNNEKGVRNLVESK